MLNMVQLIGNVGKDPEVRALQNGEKVASLTVATSERWKDKATGEGREATEWHRVSAFHPLSALIEQYVHKGSKIYVEGKLVTRKYTDGNGVEKYTTEIQARNIRFLDGKRESADTGVSEHSKAKGNAFADDSTIPF